MYWCGKCNTDMNYIGDGRYECHRAMPPLALFQKMGGTMMTTRL